MSEPVPPSIEARRESDFETELLARARAWIPAWGVADEPQDFGRALLRVAARFNSEVAERLDKVGEKAYRGFFDWLAVRGDAARPARMPVVFKMVDQATAPVLARAPVSMQADAGGASVNFETEDDVLVLPGNLAAIVGVDADKDAIYLQIPGMTTLEPLPPLPTQWRLKSFAPAGATLLQLDPQVGLEPDLIVAIAGAQYRFVTVAKDIVTIDPPVPSGAGFAANTLVEEVTAFAPFDPATRNRQAHALYLGHADLLNIDSAASIDVIGGEVLGANVDWKYWGKIAPSDTVAWQPLTPATPQPPDAIRLEKLQGSIETHPLPSGQSARWIAAFAPHVKGSTALLTGGPLQLRVNADKQSPACPLTGPSVKADAMANTTPIALDTLFYPLGKQPRLFDAFYLGCPEAFSKLNADVQLCFELSDPSADSYSVVHGGAFAESVLASVGKDGALHLDAFNASQESIAPLHGRDPLQPPSPVYGGSPSTQPPGSLEAKPIWRLPIWIVPDAVFQLPIDFQVAVAAGSHVWVWHEAALDQKQSGWLDFRELPSTTNTTAAVDALVYLDASPTPQLVALRGGVLAIRGTGPADTWSTVTTPVPLSAIAPVLSVVAGRLTTSAANGLVGITASGLLYSVTTAGVCVPLVSVPASPPLSSIVQPVAFMMGATLTVVGVDATLTQLVPYPVSAGVTPQTLQNGGTLVGGSLDAVWDGVDITVLASVLEGPNSYVVTWTPFATASTKQGLFTVPINVPAATVGGAPAVIGQNVVVPGKSADILIGSFDLTQRIRLQADIGVGIVVPKTTALLNPGDVVTIEINGNPQLLRIAAGAALPLGTDIFYPIAAIPPAAWGPITRELLAYSMPAPKTGTVQTILTDLLVDASVVSGSKLLVTISGAPGEYDVLSVTAAFVARLNPAMPGVAAGNVLGYCVPIHTGGRVAPFAKNFNPIAPFQACPTALLASGAFVFSGQTPERQPAQSLKVAGPITTTAVMGDWWGALGFPLANGVAFLLDASIGGWIRQSSDTGSNPDLSWEYWNGAWSKLPLTMEGTHNLKSSGAVSFKVPTDIIASDWAGKTSTWIRARLIGGDYGTETVTVITTPLSGGGTQQTIVRSTSGIKPPVVVSLGISYWLSDPVLPIFLLAEDSGTIRDESDANRTSGASVEAFVPLSLTLGRTERSRTGSAGTAAGVTSSADPCPSDCACSSPTGSAASSAAGGAVGSAGSMPAVVPATGRSLFLGFSAAIGGASVNVLFKVATESNHDQLAPLTVEALVGDHFVPVVVEDGTRALGESGILTLAFGEPPTFVELFGQTLNWLKITPTAKDAAAAAAWSPKLSGVYLNAGWASATETLTRELVGSSNGAPNLTFILQRPPLLADSLELRVKEPLGDEEQQALRNVDPNSVIPDDPTLPGQWVLWTQVVDPGDAGPTDRVYGLDETTGTITFGNGQAGAIPPIGIDSIVAFRYKRTEPPAAGAIDVPANSIAARTQVNLVTPVAGVEAVFSADDAAGGAPPEPDARVLRFGGTALRNRGRAVTAVDLEDLTLASSPRIAQARAIVSATGIRLIVVMRGPNPAPNRAQQRELTRLMLTVTPVAFAAARALTIEAPAIRLLRISLRLSVDTLDHAGGVAADAKSRIESLLNTLTGGSTGDGWPLGASPTADDIALALLDVNNLKSITDIGLAEALADGTEGAWPATLKLNELVQLDADALRLQFDSVEQFA